MPDASMERDKRPDEEYRVQWDFANDLETGDSLSAQAVTIADVTTGADMTATMLQSPAIDGTKVVVQIQAGTPGKKYDVTFRATSAAGDKWTRVLRFGVVN